MRGVAIVTSQLCSKATKIKGQGRPKSQGHFHTHRSIIEFTSVWKHGGQVVVTAKHIEVLSTWQYYITILQAEDCLAVLS